MLMFIHNLYKQHNTLCKVWRIIIVQISLEMLHVKGLHVKDFFSLLSVTKNRFSLLEMMLRLRPFKALKNNGSKQIKRYLHINL